MKTRVSTQAPWFIPGGQILGVKPGLTEVLRALDGRPPREIKAESGGDWSAIDPEVESSASVAVVSLIGPVTQYRGVCDWMFGGTSLEAFMAEIEAAASDESVRSVARSSCSLTRLAVRRQALRMRRIVFGRSIRLSR